MRPGRQLVERPADAHLGERVDRRRRLVEHQHVGIDQRRPDQRDQLTLARRQLRRRAGRPRVNKPSGSVSSQSLRSSSTIACSRSATLSIGRAKPRLAAIVPSNRNGSCGTTTRRVRSSSLATAVSGTPPRRTVPMVGSAKRAISRPSVVLPEPVSPTTATCWPAGIWALTSSSTGGLVVVAAAAVAERDVLDADAEHARRERDRMRRLRRPDRDVEHAEHTAQPGDRGLGLVEHLGELGDRLEEPVGEEDEADQRAGRQARCRDRG